MTKDINKLETNLYMDTEIIPMVKHSADIFLYRSTILFGSTTSGKTVLIRHILHLLKNRIPQIMVINPTNKLNNAYSELVPKQLIYDTITPELLQIIYEKQTMARQMYDKVQKIEPLYELFKKCASPTEFTHYKQMSKLYKETKDNLNNRVKHIIEKKSQLTQLKEEHQKTIRGFFKQTIRKNKKILESSNKNHTITKDEQQIIKYLDFNPNLIIIFDDCAASFSEWGKSNGLRELFFNGRHFYVTFIMTFQSDMILTPDLRINIHNSIFTTPQAALSFFENKKNGINKSEQKKYRKLVDEVFKSQDGIPNYKKLCFFKDDPNYKIQYMLANLYDEYKFGDKALWDFCEQIKKNDEDIDTNNSFYDSFNN